MREKEKFILARLRRRLLQHIQVTRVLILLVVAVFVLGFVDLVLPRVVKLGQSLSLDYRYLVTLIQGPRALKSDHGLTNILVLGVGGAGHEGPDLTDSMILFSYNQNSNKFVMVSIPRDLWMPEIRAKINTAYHYGEERKPGGGFLLAKSEASEVTGQDIQYVVLIDFNVFKEIINILGGVNICVDRTFDDYHYPIPGMENAEPESARYEHLHFDADCQTVNGDRALKFVRSRYAEGEEGTDFARSKRQQKVILAIKDKLISKGLLFDVDIFLKIRDSVLKNIITDIPQDQYPALARLAVSYRSQNITTGIIDADDPTTSHSGLLVAPPISSQEDFQWALIPKAGQGDWTEIRKYVSSLLTNQPN